MGEELGKQKNIKIHLDLECHNMSTHPFITNFPHRFEEPDLTKRNWQPTSEIYFKFQELWEKEFNFVSDDYIDCNLLVVHCLYCAASTPIKEFVYELKDFTELLKTVRAGDYLEIWSLTKNPKYYSIKCPNENGLFPEKGAY